jgi:hypothetical protein
MSDADLKLWLRRTATSLDVLALRIEGLAVQGRLRRKDCEMLKALLAETAHLLNRAQGAMSRDKPD